MRQKWILALVAATLLSPLANAARTAVPGTVNYVEGQVSIEGQKLSTAQDGTSALQANQILNTQDGKAEVLLSPGVFMRVGSNSQIRMVTPGLVDPRVEVLRGDAMIEVDQKPKQVHLTISQQGADASLLKEGLYRFDADEGRIAVFDGKAQVSRNGQTSKEFGKGRELILANADLKPEKFDTKAQDDLYKWSNVRSEYLAQANAATARTIYVNGGYGFGGWGSGWFWNPYFSTYSWLPGDGYFMSPFGYPFYSPRYIMYSPVVVGRSYVGRPYVGRPRAFSGAGMAARPQFHSVRPMGAAPAFRGRIGRR